MVGARPAVRPGAAGRGCAPPNRTMVGSPGLTGRRASRTTTWTGGSEELYTKSSSVSSGQGVAGDLVHQPAKVETLNARAGQENFPVALRVLPRTSGRTCRRSTASPASPTTSATRGARRPTSAWPRSTGSTPTSTACFDPANRRRSHRSGARAARGDDPRVLAAGGTLPAADRGEPHRPARRPLRDLGRPARVLHLLRGPGRPARPRRVRGLDAAARGALRRRLHRRSS